MSHQRRLSNVLGDLGTQLGVFAVVDVVHLPVVLVEFGAEPVGVQVGHADLVARSAQARQHALERRPGERLVGRVAEDDVGLHGCLTTPAWRSTLSRNASRRRADMVSMPYSGSHRHRVPQPVLNRIARLIVRRPLSLMVLM